MPTQPVVKRDYNFSDGTLIQLADDFRELVIRDMADLATYGITAATNTALAALRLAFFNHPTDANMLGLVIIATANKNTSRNTLEKALRGLESRATNKYQGTDNFGHVARLGIGGLTRENDNDLVRVAKGAYDVLVEIQADLASEGVNAAYVTDMLAKITDCDTKVTAQKTAIGNRDMSTQQRAEKGNALYAAIMKIASYGKDAYIETNEAKYNDYVVTEAANAIGNTREGNLAAGQKKHLDYHEIVATDKFTLKGDTTNDYEGYFSATTDGDPVGATFAILHGQTYTDKTAVELGWQELTPFFMLRYVGVGTVHYEVVKV